jgi:hypothetical protein
MAVIVVVTAEILTVFIIIVIMTTVLITFLTLSVSVCQVNAVSLPKMQRRVS